MPYAYQSLFSLNPTRCFFIFGKERPRLKQQCLLFTLVEYLHVRRQREEHGAGMEMLALLVRHPPSYAHELFSSDGMKHGRPHQRFVMAAPFLCLDIVRERLLAQIKRMLH